MRNRHWLMGRWCPEGTDSGWTASRRRPDVGELVAWDWRAWEVMHVRVLDPTDEETERLDHYPKPVQALLLPYAITLRRVHGAPAKGENSVGDIGLRIPVGSSASFPRYTDNRVPLCSCCSHPWPCRENVDGVRAAAELEKAEREMRLLPGCCPACQEPITARQKTISFPGPYVRNPLAPSDPSYHLRRACRSEAARYEELWVTAEPGRRRSLLTLKCDGSVIVHGDGTGECIGATDSDCPSIYAWHGTWSACYLQSHGCPRDCGTGHGTRLSGRPTDPRAITRPADTT